MGTLIAIFSSIFTIFGSICARYWADTDRPIFFWLTMLFYVVSSVSFPFALRFGTLSVLATFASGFTAVVTLLFGIFLFREHLTPVHSVGVFLGIAAVVLLAWPAK